MFTDRSLEQDLSINDADLDTEFITYPSILHYWLRVYAHVEHEADTAKLAYKIKQDEVYMEKKSQSLKGEKTIKQLEVETALDPRTKSAAQNDRMMRREMIKMKYAVEAIRAKLDCLRSLGAKKRTEMNAIEPRVQETPVRGIPDRSAYMNKPPRGKV